MKIVIIIILIFTFSFLPSSFAIENATKQDILNLQNEINNLESLTDNQTNEIKKELGDVKLSVELINENITKLDKSLQSAFAVTWGISNIQLFISIASGAIIAITIMGISHLISPYTDKKTAEKLLNHDFEDVNERVVILITNLRNTLRQIDPNSNIINSLIKREQTPREFMRHFLVGLLFFRWNAALTKMSSMKHDQVEIVSKLHEFIIQTDTLPGLDIGLVSEVIEGILDSNKKETEKRDEISQALRIDLNSRLTHYDNTFHIMRRDLEPINWIKLSNEHFK